MLPCSARQSSVSRSLRPHQSFTSTPHIPSVALALTLFAVVMVGEAVREAFDPKVFSRLR